MTPPVLPSLQADDMTSACDCKPQSCEGYDVTFAKAEEAVGCSSFVVGANEMSVGELYWHFFSFYSEHFNTTRDVASIKNGVIGSKLLRWSRPKAWRLSIEDPFETDRDLGSLRAVSVSTVI